MYCILRMVAVADSNNDRPSDAEMTDHQMLKMTLTAEVEMSGLFNDGPPLDSPEILISFVSFGIISLSHKINKYYY